MSKNTITSRSKDRGFLGHVMAILDNTASEGAVLEPFKAHLLHGLRMTSSCK